jgi:hypothetical protein
MAFNIFEGARRIGRIILACVAIIGVVSNWNVEPYVLLKYQVPSFQAIPTKIEECSDSDAVQYLNRYTTSGKKIYINLCFKAHRADSGELLIPYAVSDRGYWLNEKYDKEVVKYTSAVAEKFSIPRDGPDSLDSIWMKQKWIRFLEGISATAAALIGTWALFYIIGWVARGFAGIPQGKDRREAA